MTARQEIIVVDDEPDLRDLLVDYLGSQGFEVRTAADGAALDALLAERPADLVVLDVNMPGEDGFSVARRLRAAGNNAGILMLTAAGTVENRVEGLTGGADDYLGKPFQLRELLARVRSILRRIEAPTPVAGQAKAAPAGKSAPFGPFVLDMAARRLIGPAGDVALTAMEYDLVVTFVRHPGQTLSRDRLSELAHNKPLEPGDRSIDIRITRLRQKLESDPANPQIIRTVRGEGYVFSPS
ncbi:MAG: response regulator [Geminicoccaceae bacterium]